MDNAFEEAPSPSHRRRSAVTTAPEHRNPPKAGFYASMYNIYVYFYVYFIDTGEGSQVPLCCAVL